MARPSTPANVTIGTYTPLTGNPPTPAAYTVNSNGHACAVGADMAIWDTVSNAFVRVDVTSAVPND